MDVSEAMSIRVCRMDTSPIRAKATDEVEGHCCPRVLDLFAAKLAAHRRCPHRAPGHFSTAVPQTGRIRLSSRWLPARVVTVAGIARLNRPRGARSSVARIFHLTGNESASLACGRQAGDERSPARCGRSSTAISCRATGSRPDLDLPPIWISPLSGPSPLSQQ